MAGGKETPRQKMIGIMYLVLLALLALQVSSTIINKFQDINESMEVGLKEFDQRNFETLTDIQLAVKNAKNNAEDMAVLKKAQELRKKTTEIRAYMKAQKEELIKVTGGLDEEGNFIGAKEEESVMQYMLGAGETKSGEAYTMQEKLNTYVSYLNGLAKDIKSSKSFGKMALDAKDDERYSKDNEQKNKDFAHLNFESTPMVASLAVISEMETRIMNMESEMLGELREKLDATTIKVDKIRPVVRQNAKYVVAGTEYEADMFMAAYSSKITPTMTYNEQSVDVDGQGVGNIKFRATGGAYDANGRLKKTWKGSITFPKAGGGDTTYTFEQDYYVVKPAIQVQAASVQTLYRNCGNKISFQVPALGADYSPTITATGATVINGNQPGDVVIVPSSPNVTVRINNNGTFIGEKKFKVRLVPKPDISINLSQRRPEHPSRLSRLKINCTLPDDFRTLNPRDANVKVTKFKAYLIRNNRPVIQREFRSNGSGLSQFAAEARDGDRVLIEVLQVKRRNFRGRSEVVRIPDTIFNIPLAR